MLNSVTGPLQLMLISHEVMHLLAGAGGDQVQSTIEEWHVPTTSMLSGEA